MFRTALPRFTVLCALAAATAFSAGEPSVALADNPPHTVPGATFAVTPSSAPATPGSAPFPSASSAAAVIDGHVIPTEDVIAILLREDGAFVVDQLVQNYVVDRECERRGVTVAPAEIDAKIEALRADVAPATLEQAMAAHHTTLAELRGQFKQDIERERLVLDQVPPTRMVRCRAIVVKWSSPGAPETVAGTTRTRAQAVAEIKRLQSRLAAGADFGALAAKYSDLAADKAGDVGVLYKGMHDMDTALLDAGLALGVGRSAAGPVAMNDACCLLLAVSDSDNHPRSEDDAYASALAVYKDQQAQFLEPQEIVDLIARSKITYYVHN